MNKKFRIGIEKTTNAYHLCVYNILDFLIHKKDPILIKAWPLFRPHVPILILLSLINNKKSEKDLVILYYRKFIRKEIETHP
jgi:hypothetical protein